jgi:hypothetical protein
MIVVDREAIEILEGVGVVEGFTLVLVVGHVVVGAAPVAAPVDVVAPVRGRVTIHDLAIVYTATKKKHKKRAKIIKWFI